MKKFLLVLLVVIMSTMVVMAGTDDQGAPNDPAQNDRANACYEEGTLEGKCDTEWEWQCGWHLIRWEADGSYSVPLECSRILPTNGCITHSYLHYVSDVFVDQAHVVVDDDFLNACGELTTSNVTVVNAYEISANNWSCQTAGLPYEVKVTWTSASGSFENLYTGNCLEPE